jgi:hypothetical protein
MRRLVIALTATAMLLTACGGSDGGAGSGATSGTTGGSTETTAGSSATDSTAAQTTAAPETTAATVDPFVSPTGAPVIVDGHVYDVCALLDPAVVSTLIGEGSRVSPRSLSEIATLAQQSPADSEGAVECLSGQPYDPAKNGVASVSLTVWSDSSVAYALQDPSATAAARVATILPIVRTSRAAFGSTALSKDLPGGGWADHDQFSNSFVGAVGDGVVVELRVGVYEACNGDGAAATACWQAQVDNAVKVGQPMLDAALKALTAGDGPAADWPTAPAPESLTYKGSQGDVDACKVALDALNAAAPNDKYQYVEQSTMSQTSSSGATLLAPMCEFEPVDRDQAITVDLLLPAASPDADKYVADGRDSIDPSQAVPPGGDDGYVSYNGEIWVHKNGQWIGFRTIPAAAVGYAPYDGHLDAAFAQIVAAL